MRKLKVIFFFIFLASILTTCKKYPNDPFISLKTAKKRLIGEWELISVYVDGADSTLQIRQRCGCYLEIPDETDNSVQSGGCNPTGPCGSSKEWSLDSRKNLIMEAFLVLPPPLNPPYYSTAVEYLTHYILKLYKKELKFKVTNPVNKKEYVFEYKKIY